MLNWLRSSQAEGGSGAVRGSPLRPQIHHPVRSLVSSIQAQSARPGGDDGRAWPVDGAYDHYALGAAVRMKQRLAVMLGFKGFKNAAITIAGIELLHRIRKGQFGLGRLGVQGQAAPEVWNAVLGA